MKSLLILMLLIPTVVIARDVSYTWDIVDKATDGDTIIVSQYNLYCNWGDATTDTNSYTNILDPGDYTCELTAVYKGEESARSEIVSFNIPELTPEAPKSIIIDGSFRVKISFGQ